MTRTFSASHSPSDTRRPSSDIRPPISVSVVVPAYNAEKTLGACLDALFRQTVDAGLYEVIVVDDGATDGTSEIARRFPVEYFHQANQGPAAARNLGARQARGDLLLFTDSDCVPAPDWIEEMTRPFSDVAVAAAKGAYRTKQKEFSARFAQIEFEDRYDLLEAAPNVDMIDTYSAAYRTRVFLEAGGFDQSFPYPNNEDTDLSYRLAGAGHRMVFNPRAIVFHTHPQTLSKYLGIKFRRGYWRMFVYRRYPQKAVRDSYTPGVLKIQTLLMALAMAVLPFSLFVQSLLVIVGLCCAGTILSTIPFCLKAFGKDKTVGLLAWGVILLRSVVFAAGSILGGVRSFISPL